MDDETEIDDTEVEAPPAPPRFTDFLTDFRNGALDIEINDKLDEVIDAVLRTGKAGSVDLKIKVAKNGDMMVAVVAELNGKVPELAEPRLYWRGVDGRLTRDNPMAPRIPGT